MQHDTIDIDKVARLARLELSVEEKALFKGQLASILGFVETLKELDLGDIKPTSCPHDSLGIPREDISSEGLSQIDFLKNAPDSQSGSIRLPRVVEG